MHHATMMMMDISMEDTKMRYISHYEEYAIYEPAEGGYYYPGNKLVSKGLPVEVKK